MLQRYYRYDGAGCAISRKKHYVTQYTWMDPLDEIYDNLELTHTNSYYKIIGLHHLLKSMCQVYVRVWIHLVNDSLHIFTPCAVPDLLFPPDKFTR